jgi:cysteinyl-tRNA synthetase
MALRVHNSLTRRIEPFVPLDPPKVALYGCGPTVYAHVHVGNWSSFLFYDLFVRWLRASGYAVTYAMNITDVDDKIIRDAGKAGMDRAAFTKKWTDLFLQDLEALGCTMPDLVPRATDHVPGMVAMIQRLLDRRHAYVADDGSVYFAIASFAAYGQLKSLTAESVRAGASGRVRADEYEKESVGDFALWKAWAPEDGAVAWEPTFVVDGVPRVVKGRPGWHIECSAMATALLGERIDVHLGGEDLLFPHHENEIAQSEAATGRTPFVRYWMHRRHLLVDGAKMSKSKKNFYTVKNLVERQGERAPRAFRYLVASAHYRSPIDFTWAGLEAAGKTLLNLEDARRRLARASEGARASEFAAPYAKRFAEAMDEDLETSRALAAVHEMLHEANRRKDLAPADAASALALLDRVDAVLGLGLASAGRTLTPEQQTLLDARAAARARKDFAEADRLRGALSAQGVLVKDGSSGQQEVFFP